MTERTLLQQYVQIGVVVSAYWFISITLGELSLISVIIYGPLIGLEGSHDLDTGL